MIVALSDGGLNDHDIGTTLEAYPTEPSGGLPASATRTDRMLIRVYQWPLRFIVHRCACWLR